MLIVYSFCKVYVAVTLSARAPSWATC